MRNLVIKDEIKLAWFLIASIYIFYILTDHLPTGVMDYSTLIYNVVYSFVSLLFVFYTLIVLSKMSGSVKLFCIIIFSFFTSLSLSYYVISNDKIDFNVIAASYESNIAEAFDFILSADIMFNVLLFLFFFLFMFFLVKQIVNIKYISLDMERIFLYTLFSLVVGPLALLKTAEANSETSLKESLFSLTLKETPLLREIFILDKFYEQRKLISTAIPPAWKNVNRKKSDYKNYIVIIGESARRKNFGIYGSNINTTPELDNIKGLTVVKNAFSSSSVTRVSIPYMLNLATHEQVDYRYNIVDLINISGLTSYWVSNQGFIGDYDTPITRIAKQASQTKFINKSYADSRNDQVLLGELSRIISSNPELQKVIFLHTIGSHRDFCQRSWLPFYQVIDNPKEINCYNSSIRNTSIFIEQVNHIVKGQKSKIIYFSDHALVAVKDKPFFVHGVGKLLTKEALEIPMLFIDNSKNTATVQWVNKIYNMSYLTHTLAHWMGITADRIDYSKSIYSVDYNFNERDAFYYHPSSYKKIPLDVYGLNSEKNGKNLNN